MLDLFRLGWQPRQKDASPAHDPAAEVDRSSLADLVRALQRADEDDREGCARSDAD